MSKKIQKKIEDLLFEVYEKGLQQETTDLTAYYEKVRQALNIPDVSKQRELLIAFVKWTNRVDYKPETKIDDDVNNYLSNL
jgi:hypothetical protein